MLPSSIVVQYRSVGETQREIKRQIDEEFQAKHWGREEEAELRRDKFREEVLVVEKFMGLL